MRTSLRSLAIIGSLAIGAALITAPAASAAPAPGKDKLCGWTGNVVPLMERADRLVRNPRVLTRVQALYGANATITAYTRMEVDMLASNPAATKPMDARTLTDNRVSYNLAVSFGGSEAVASAQVRFDGLCYRTTVVVNEAWVGSTGTDKPLKVNANKALTLAQDYRKAHSADFPLDEPLVMMNLMQATTAPPDFGKLRWYVNYSNGMGGLSILAVYMNGRVTPMT